MHSLYDFLMGNKKENGKHFTHNKLLHRYPMRQKEIQVFYHNIESHIHIDQHDYHCLIGHDINIGFFLFSIRKYSNSASWQCHIPSGDPKGKDLKKWVL